MLPAIIDKLQRERPAALLINGSSTAHQRLVNGSSLNIGTAVWWPSMLALQGQMLALPLPNFSAVAMHNCIVQLHSGTIHTSSTSAYSNLVYVEAFIKGGIELCAVVLKPAMRGCSPHQGSLSLFSSMKS